VLDFGVAKWAEQAHQTQHGVVRGKLAYLSPEQVTGTNIDRRTDVWALGVCLWESVTGRRLFKRSDDRETVRAILRAEIPRASTISKHVPPELDHVIARALALDPARRYLTTRELGRGLRRFLANSGRSGGSAEVAELLSSLSLPGLARRRSLCRQVATFEEVTAISAGTPRRRVTIPFPATRAHPVANPRSDSRRTAWARAALGALVGVMIASVAVVAVPRRAERETPASTASTIHRPTAPSSHEAASRERATPTGDADASSADAAASQRIQSERPPTIPERAQRSRAGSASTARIVADGRLRIDGAVGASVIVDGAARGTAPLVIALPAGAHTVVVRRAGGVATPPTVVMIEPGAETLVSTRL
jgi:serine/threonine protein kinase